MDMAKRYHEQVLLQVGQKARIKQYWRGQSKVVGALGLWDDCQDPLRCTWCDELMEDREQVATHEKGCELKLPYRQARTVTMRDAKLWQEALQQQELPALTLGSMVVKNVVDNEVVGTLLSGDSSCERDIEQADSCT
eukprot:COSAG01_NODE_3267_length_6330_cov_133.385331_3_plen_137_part_00